MFINFKVIDSISLKPIKGFKIKVECKNFDSQHVGDGEILVGLPKTCQIINLTINAPLYKNITYNLDTTEISKNLVVGLEFIDVFEEEVVTA